MNRRQKKKLRKKLHDCNTHKNMNAVKRCMAYGFQVKIVEWALKEAAREARKSTESFIKLSKYKQEPCITVTNALREEEKEMQEKRVQSIQEMKLSTLNMPMLAVYKSPDDFPGYYVVRVYDMEKPTDTVMVKRSLTEIEMDIRTHTGMVFIPRSKEDVESLVGVWM